MNFLDSLFNDIASVDINNVNIDNIDNVVEQTKNVNMQKEKAASTDPKHERLMSSKKGLLSPFALRHEDKEEKAEKEPEPEKAKKVSPKDVDDMIFLGSLYDEVDEGEAYYKEKQQQEAERQKELEKEKKKKMLESLRPEDYIYEKSMHCPVCDNKFKALAVRTGKAEFVEKNMLLRPTFSPLQPFYYDVAICTKCGYAGLVNHFDDIMPSQIAFISSNIKFEDKFKHSFNFISAEAAIDRYRHLLLNAAVKKAKASEKAYCCLRISWIYSILEDVENELKFCKSAYQGYASAYEREYPPYFGNVDEMTALYLLSALAYKQGLFHDAKKYLGDLVAKRNIPDKLKNNVEELKELLKKG